MTHYFKKGRRGEKKLIPLTIHGFTFEFVTYTSLFSGSRIDHGTLLLLENIKVPDKGFVLDIGCGYGVIGIVVAKMNPKLKVYMTDINPLAIKIARENIRRNNVEDRVVVLQGNCYEPVRNLKFQAIYSNPPLSAGNKVVLDIILNAKKYLASNGFAQFVIARGKEYIVKEVRKQYSVVNIINKKGYTILYLEA